MMFWGFCSRKGYKRDSDRFIQGFYSGRNRIYPVRNTRPLTFSLWFWSTWEIWVLWTLNYTWFYPPIRSQINAQKSEQLFSIHEWMISCHANSLWLKITDWRQLLHNILQWHIHTPENFTLKITEIHPVWKSQKANDRWGIPQQSWPKICGEKKVMWPRQRTRTWIGCHVARPVT